MISTVAPSKGIQQEVLFPIDYELFYEVWLGSLTSQCLSFRWEWNLLRLFIAQLPGRSGSWQHRWLVGSTITTLDPNSSSSSRLFRFDTYSTTITLFHSKRLVLPIPGCYQIAQSLTRSMVGAPPPFWLSSSAPHQLCHSAGIAIYRWRRDIDDFQTHLLCQNRIQSSSWELDVVHLLLLVP